MKPLFSIILLLFLSCNHTLKSTKIDLCFGKNFSQHVEKVSLNDIDKIKTFNQKFIEIEGYLTNEFENVALYPYKWSESNKALWLNFCDSIIKNREELSLLNYQKVVVIGRVNILHKGHYSGYIAELDSIFCIKKE
jgi:hypothetical protein